MSEEKISIRKDRSSKIVEEFLRRNYIIIWDEIDSERVKCRLRDSNGYTISVCVVTDRTNVGGSKSKNGGYRTFSLERQKYMLMEYALRRLAEKIGLDFQIGVREKLENIISGMNEFEEREDVQRFLSLDRGMQKLLENSKGVFSERTRQNFISDWSKVKSAAQHCINSNLPSAQSLDLMWDCLNEYLDVYRKKMGMLPEKIDASKTCKGESKDAGSRKKNWIPEDWMRPDPDSQAGFELENAEASEAENNEDGW